jgi:ribosome-binding protein aMBF1 (putative translation factor)
MPLPCGGEGTFQGLLGVSLVSPLRAVAGQRPALAVSQSDFFQFGHAAVPAGVQSERLRQAKATKGFAWCMDLRHVFAANLRRLRHAKGLSQEDLAYEADVNRSYMSKLEKGASYPGLEIIGKLATVLDIEATELLKPPMRRKARNR